MRSDWRTKKILFQIMLSPFLPFLRMRARLPQNYSERFGEGKYIDTHTHTHKRTTHTREYVYNKIRRLGAKTRKRERERVRESELTDFEREKRFSWEGRVLV